MMKKIVLLMVIAKVYFPFEIKGTNRRHLSEEDRQIINDVLSEDEFFRGMKQVKILGSGGYGVVVHMQKSVGMDDDITLDFAVKIGNDYKLISYTDTIDDDLMAVPSDALNDTIRGVRVTDYLRIRQIPFVTYVHTYRHIVFGRTPPEVDEDDESETKKKFDPVGSKVVQVMDLAPAGDLYDYSKWLKENKTKTERKAAWLDIFYKYMLIYSKVKDLGIIHGDIKEENTFLVKTKVFGEDIFPVIGDWDLAYKYDITDETPSMTKYTLYYRPPEMGYYTMRNNALDQGTFGYRYSGKEDIYAIAVMMLSISKNMNIVLDEGIKKIITMMAYPVDYESLKLIANEAKLRRGESTYRFFEKIGEFIPTEYKDLQRQLHEVARTILEEIKANFLNDNPHVVYIKDRESHYQKDGEMEGNYHHLLRRFLNSFGYSRTALNNLLDFLFTEKPFLAAMIGKFFNVEAQFQRTNAFQHIVDSRPEPEVVVELLKAALVPDLSYGAVKRAILDDIDKLSRVSRNLHPFTDIKKSAIHVHPTFYNLNGQTMLNMTRNFDIFRRLSSGGYGDEIDIPDDDPAFYPLYNYCGQLRNALGRIKVNDPRDLTRPFKSLFRRKIRKLLGKKESKYEYSPSETMPKKTAKKVNSSNNVI